MCLKKGLSNVFFINKISTASLLHSKLVNFIHAHISEGVWYGNLIIYEGNLLMIFSGASKRDKNNAIRV